MLCMVPIRSIVFTSADGVALHAPGRRDPVARLVGSGDVVQAGLGRRRCPAKVIRCSIDSYLHRGWTRDHLGLSPVDIDILADPDRVVPHLLERLAPRADDGLAERARQRLAARRQAGRQHRRKRPLSGDPQAIGLWDIGEALHAGAGAASRSA